MARKVLNSVADVLQFFKTQTYDYVFLSASNFNLMDMQRWVPRWTHINSLDCYDGSNPSVFLPNAPVDELLDSIEKINLFLLKQPTVKKHIGKNTKVMCLFFNEQLEEEIKRLGAQLMLPPHRLVKQIDNKIETTQIGNRLGISSVPNVITKVVSYQQLLQVAKEHGLGSDWVIQTEFGDSGKTTYFIANQQDYLNVAKELQAEEQVKLMKRIRCQGTAIEACATRWGTLVGPLMTELIGLPQLTPYAGGWCGNEIRSDDLSVEVREKAADMTRRFGDALYQMGYRGYFEVDFLIDLDTQSVYLGEVNSRISGVTTLTNTSIFSQKNIPLFLFHLLEYDDSVELGFSVESFNQAVKSNGYEGVNAQLIFKHTPDALQKIESAPASGIYRVGSDGKLEWVRTGYERSSASHLDEIFLMRIAKESEYAYHGGDLAIVFFNQPLTNRDPGQLAQLSPSALLWVEAVDKAFKRRELNAEEQALFTRYVNPSSGKF